MFPLVCDENNYAICRKVMEERKPVLPFMAPLIADVKVRGEVALHHIFQHATYNCQGMRCGGHSQSFKGRMSKLYSRIFKSNGEKF
jgi:hypothetical protein